VTALPRRYGLIIVVGLVIALIVGSGAWKLLSVRELEAHHAQLRAFVRRSPVESAAAFYAAYVIAVVACVPGPMTAMSAVSGYLFGALPGGLLSLAASVTGSVVVFLACRSAFAEAIASRGGERVRQLEEALNRNAFSYLLTLRLMPVTPFFLPNVAAGLAGVRLSALIWATAIGTAPVSFILASLGSGLSHAIDLGASPGYHLFSRAGVILPLIGLTLLSAASVAWRLLRRGRSLPAPPA
jgi:uncharacterized membrane protein YdjX (TVP38/TMEM64 family)